MGAFNVIVENLAIVQEKVQQALNNRLNEKFDQTVKIIAITKNNDIYAMREAIDAGIKVVGENRIQEALDKKKEHNRTVE